MIVVRVEDGAHLTEEGLQEKYEALSEQRQEKVKQCKQRAGQIESITAGSILEEELQKQNVKKPYQYRMDKNKKPSLKNDKGIQFSITHSKQLAAVAIGSQPVGVDLERMTSERVEKKSEANLRLARRFFMEEEYQWIVEKASYADVRFYQIWTFKEAVAKCLNISLSKVFSSVSYLKEYPCEQICGSNVDGGQIWIRQWRGGEWIMTLCVQGEEEEIHLKLEEDKVCALVR